MSYHDAGSSQGRRIIVQVNMERARYLALRIVK